MDGVIRLSAHCDSSCQLSWSRISAIQITPVPDDSNSEAGANSATGATATGKIKYKNKIIYKIFNKNKLHRIFLLFVSLFSV